jgi:chromate transporter
VKSSVLAVAGVVCMALSFLGVNALVILAGTGAIVAFAHVFLGPRKEHRVTGPRAFLLLMRSVRLKVARLLPFAGAGAATSVAQGLTPGLAPGMWTLFLVFLKIGSVVFGSGYVLLAFLRTDLVVHRAWVTDSQLVDAVAIGQVTPGPVFTTATFIGYLLRGPAGAAVATVGIFLPAFILVAISGPLIPFIRRSATAGAFLDGVNVASLALMAVVSYQLGRSAIVDWLTVGLAIAGAFLLLRWRINSAWLVLGGALAGIAAQFIRGT